VEAVFDHPATEPEWYWADDFDSHWKSLGLSDDLLVAYLTRLFREPICLKGYSLEQVAQGVWFLVGEASPAQPSCALVRPGVALDARTLCVRAITNFFRSFVAPAAPGPARTDSDPFHIAIYMWWDIFPSWGGPQSGEPDLHRSCLSVMADVLEIPVELCRLSALHGLNHWHLHYPAEVEALIDTFLRETGDVTARIRDYAAIARQGCAQ
jgi:hypothetical protein